MSENIIIQNSELLEDERDMPISLAKLFLIFLKIGSLAFGGFMALISVIEESIVKQHKLLEHRDMLDGIALATLLPGPMAVNVVAFAGYKIRGKLGAIVATTAVILPSFILILTLSFIYFNYGEVAGFGSIFQGFLPAIAAIVISVVWRLGKKTLTGKIELFLAVLSAAIFFILPLQYKIYAPLLLFGFAGLIGFKLFYKPLGVESSTSPLTNVINIKLLLTLAFFISLIVIWFLPLPLEKNSLLFLTLTFASMSLMLFGGGYVFIPIMGSIVVLKYGWLTQQQFIDGIALGQVTPGPIIISATFIGYKVSGIWGAICATIAIFSVPALLMITVSQWLGAIQRSPGIQAAMKGIHCVVIGMIFVAALIILKSAFPVWPISISGAWPTIFIFIAALIALLKFNLDLIWVIPVSGLLGYVFL